MFMVYVWTTSLYFVVVVIVVINRTLNTSDIDCGLISHECLGCCKYSQLASCPSLQSQSSRLTYDNILVLRCCKFIIKSYKYRKD